MTDMTIENNEVADAISEDVLDETPQEKNPHLAKAVAMRDKYKGQAKDLVLQNKDLQTQLKKMTKAQNVADQDKDAMLISADEDLKELTQKYEAVENELVTMRQGALREKVSQDILMTVNSNCRDRAGAMLDGLMARGDINLLPDEDDREDEVERARTVLKNLDPALFVADARRAAGVPGNLPGVKTPEKTPSNGDPNKPMHLSQRLRLERQQK